MCVRPLSLSVPVLRGVPSGAVPRRLVATAVGLALFAVAETVVRVFGLAGAEAGLTLAFFGGAATSLPFLVGIAYLGEWLDESDIDASRHSRVWWWTVGAAAASVGLNLILMAVLPLASTMQAMSWLRWGASTGAGVGVLVGVTEARAVENATEAERSRVRAEHLERERDRLDYLNSLLRHEVLNAANEIAGYASLLRDDHGPGTRVHEYSGRIDDRTDALTSVIDDVRVLLQASQPEQPTDRVDAAALVEAEIERVADIHPDASISLSAPGEAPAVADDLVSRTFRALLENALEHGDGETHVDVTVERGDDWVTVRVADDGDGIPEDVRASLFERPSRRDADHPLGLYIAAQLVEGYGGSITLVDTGPDGTTFEVELPTEAPGLAEAQTAEPAERAAVDD
jgi:two-component system OmpR family sensor kinase